MSDKEYEVKMYETVFHTTIVTAKDKEDAYNKAYEVIANGPSDGYDTEADGFTGDVQVTEL